MTSPETSSPRLVDVTLAELRRTLITAILLLTVLYLFLAMVGSVLLAGVLGVVAGIYLLPVARWVESGVGSRALGAVVALGVVLLPLAGVAVYGYGEVADTTAYLSTHSEEVAAEIDESFRALPLVRTGAPEAIEGAVRTAVRYGESLPGRLQGVLAGFMVGLGIFLFTAFYVMTEPESIVEYMRGTIPPRYSTLVESLEAHARGVLYGTIFSVLLTQAIKALVLFGLFLLLDVPLPVTLAVVSFFIGFFPVVGSWTVYVPAAGYLLVFENAPVRALILVVTAFAVSTFLLSLLIRPKLAAERSQVLNFYWMFLGLVAGVYAFGVPGVIVGPLLIGLLKAVIDTVRATESWRSPPTDPEDPDATVLAEEKLEGSNG